MMKVIFVLMCTLIMLSMEIVVVSAEGTEPDILIQYWFYEDIEEMISRSTDAVELEILDKHVKLVNIWGNDPATIHQARVLNVFQGDLTVGDVIEVRQIGGRVDGITLNNPSMVHLSPGDHVVLFLNGVDGVSYFGIGVPYQAAYIINEDGELISYHDNPFPNEELTWEILEQIQRDNGIEPSDNNETDSNGNNGTGLNDDVETNPITDESNGLRNIGIVVAGTIILTAVFILLTRRSKNKK